MDGLAHAGLQAPSPGKQTKPSESCFAVPNEQVNTPHPTPCSHSFLSCRPDLVPPEYLRELEKLQDQIPPFSTELALRVIREEYGAPPSAVFSEISPEPLAAASLGQVGPWLAGL